MLRDAHPLSALFLDFPFHSRKGIERKWLALKTTLANMGMSPLIGMLERALRFGVGRRDAVLDGIVAKHALDIHRAVVVVRRLLESGDETAAPVESLVRLLEMCALDYASYIVRNFATRDFPEFARFLQRGELWNYPRDEGRTIDNRALRTIWLAGFGQATAFYGPRRLPLYQEQVFQKVLTPVHVCTPRLLRSADRFGDSAAIVSP